jgi:hypothetical protein
MISYVNEILVAKCVVLIVFIRIDLLKQIGKKRRERNGPPAAFYWKVN